MDFESQNNSLGIDDKVEEYQPRKYNVVLYNDDYTSIDFVIHVLHRIFHHSIEESETITQQIHNAGKGVGGVYPYDIAESKAKKTVEMARINGFPLRCEIEEE